MHFTINLQKLTGYGHEVLGYPGLLWKLEVSKLKGGYVSNQLYRHNLTFRLAEGNFRTVSVVQKYTSEAEVRVMAALGEIFTAKALPYVIDLVVDGAATDDEEMANWFITPFYEGAALTFDDEIPICVIESLAQVHVHFASRVKQFEGLRSLYRVDGHFFRRTFTNALEALAQLPQMQSQVMIADLQKVSQSSIFEATLAKLPVTLTHGDVHPGNILHSSEGKSVLIDWGNARIAPAMLDLANVVAIGSTNWTAYLSAWAKAGGEALDPDLLRRNYYWAVAMVNLQYLPFATHYLPENVAGMIERILDAKDKLLTGDIL